MAKRELTEAEQKAKAQKKEKVKGWSFFVGVILLSIKLLIAKLWGIEIPENTYDILLDLILAVAAPFSAFRNNYIFKKGIKQFHILWNSKLQ